MKNDHVKKPLGNILLNFYKPLFLCLIFEYSNAFLSYFVLQPKKSSICSVFSEGF